MDTKELDLDEIAKYVRYVNNIYKINKVILFGSYAKKTPTTNSDIDLALISKQFGRRPLIEAIELYKIRHKAGIEINIQPHSFGLDEFNNNADDFFIDEIIKTGIDITDKVLPKTSQNEYKASDN
ncbi:MAG: nucleotidyltransferase domain-containing protein [Firmicutes bacterium]|nr:nucleotidyltransferase domain-containing protein [Bacillota bacterium]